MKKLIAAFTVFAFVFALSATSVVAATSGAATAVEIFSSEKNPKADGTKKTAKSDKKSSSCSSSCGDKSDKASSDCGSKKATTAEATSSDKK